MTKKKTWLEKLHEKKEPQIKRIESGFADIPAGSTMLIASPKLIDQYIQEISFGKQVNSKTLRKDLALDHHADYTCPVTTGIFLRIVAEASYEKFQKGAPIDQITPFWRVVEPKSPLAKKLSFGESFLVEQINKEKEHTI